MNYSSNKPFRKLVDTPLIEVVDDGQQLRAYLRVKDGAVVEHEPFTRDQRGICAALMLAADVNAGKFFLSRVLRTEPGQRRIGNEGAADALAINDMADARGGS